MIGTDVHRAAKLLKSGKLVAIPTETVYGLAANASRPFNKFTRAAVSLTLVNASLERIDDSLSPDDKVRSIFLKITKKHNPKASHQSTPVN